LRSISRLPRPARWLILLALSALLAALLEAAKLPAALMLGPMIAAILIETAQAGIKLPKLPFNLAQGIVGCMIARAITPDIAHVFLRQWPLFLSVVLLVIAFNCTLGWTICKLRILPGTTAIWGLLPGAASAMLVMAEDYGADTRLVAFMQYARVLMVALFASLLARFWAHTTATSAAFDWFPPIRWIPFLETLIVILGGVALGRASKFSAGMLLIPLIAGTALHLGGIIEMELPGWLLAMGYLFIGWQIGLRFTRDVLAEVWHVLPKVLLAILTAIVFCGGLAVVLAEWVGIAPLTAYLATSPGGVDAVAIIAATAKVDVGFVMALQLARTLLVLLVGPIFSRFAADRI
jgi:membrane AbrB-like protein